MPRGNGKGNPNKSPIGTTGNIYLNAEENASLTSHVKNLFIQSTRQKEVDLHDEQDVTRAVIEYFSNCETSGMRPGNLGLYAALGMSRQDVNNVLTGKSKSKASPAVIDVLKKAIYAIGAYREQLGAQGKINPVTMIFWQKNYDGLTDTTNIQVSTDNERQAQLSPEQIAQQIEKDIPIDADYKQIEE